MIAVFSWQAVCCLHVTLTLPSVNTHSVRRHWLGPKFFLYSLESQEALTNTLTHYQEPLQGLSEISAQPQMAQVSAVASAFTRLQSGVQHQVDLNTRGHEQQRRTAGSLAVVEVQPDRDQHKADISHPGITRSPDRCFTDPSITHNDWGSHIPVTRATFFV